jgi:3-oxoacyl-[acyl-carrier protein] reductase
MDSNLFEDKKILITGASSDLAVPLNKKLVGSGATVGLHYNTGGEKLSDYREGDKIRKIKANLKSSKDCYKLVDSFVDWAGGIDILIILIGGIKEAVSWEELTDDNWKDDLNINLIVPFFLAQRAIKYMKKNGGRIIFTSTASASHGGGSKSMVYGLAKGALECMTKGLARECAGYNILVNAVAPGFIMTKFHTEKMHRSREQLEARAKLVLLKRAGTSKEVAEAIMFLISKNASYITGHILPVCGGDWL